MAESCPGFLQTVFREQLRAPVENVLETSFEMIIKARLLYAWICLSLAKPMLLIISQHQNRHLLSCGVQDDIVSFNQKQRLCSLLDRINVVTVVLEHLQDAARDKRLWGENNDRTQTHTQLREAIEELVRVQNRLQGMFDMIRTAERDALATQQSQKSIEMSQASILESKRTKLSEGYRLLNGIKGVADMLQSQYLLLYLCKTKLCQRHSFAG